MKFITVIFIFLSCVSFAQAGNSESLVVIHYDPAGQAQMRQQIYKYNFVNDVYAGREVVMSVDGRKNDKDYIRFDKGENTLYRERYLVSASGGVVDLKEKKVLHDGSAMLVRCSGDSIIFYTNDIFKGKYYSWYDLKNNTFSEIRNPAFKAITGQDVEFDRTKSPYKLYYYPVDKPKVLLMEDAGHGGVSATYKLAGIPIYWIDNNTFLFPNVKVSNLQGAIVKYNLLTKTSKEIGTFNSTSNLSANFKFQKAHGNTFVEFYFKDKLYLINPVKETMLLTNYREMDANFSVEVEAKSTGRGVWYKGKEIGKNHFEINNFKASATHAAIVKELVMGDESYQQGLAVYNINKAKWEDVDAEEVVALIGWIKQ